MVKRDRVSQRRNSRGPGRPRDHVKGDAILKAGWALFLEKGVGAVSIEAIAARAGVSKMTVYKHFTDKHALFEEAVRREMRAIEASQKIAPVDGEPPGLEARLRAFGIGIMSFLASSPAIDFYNVLAGELRRHPDLARTFYEAGPRRTIEELAAILSDAGDGLRVDDPIRSAEALFGLWQGASNFRLALGGDAEAANIAERVDFGILLFLHAYRSHSPANGG